MIMVFGPGLSFGQNGYGSPVYKQDFGIGNANPATLGPPLPAVNTQFPYDNAVCPAAGKYTIARRVPVANCFGGEWIGLSSDANAFISYGMMMLVNNTAAPGNLIVYADTVNKPLCSEVTYNFSTAFINLDLIDGWVACPNQPDYPIFEMRIEDGNGNIIKADTTSPLTSYAAPPLMGYKFSHRGFDFNVPPGTNKIVLKITLFRLAYACAEDFAIDEVQIRPLGPQATVSFDNEPSTTIVKSVCFQHNRIVSLTGIVEDFYTNTALQWQESTDNGSTWVDIPGATTLNYSKLCSVADTFLVRLSAGEAVTMSNPNCRVASNALKIEVDGLPTGYTITNNSPVCAGHDLVFNAEGGASYEWTGPNGFYDNIPYPHIFSSSLADSGWYYVDVYSNGGCRKRDSTYAIVIGTNVYARPDTGICKGEYVKLEASPGASYSWYPADGLSSTTVRTPIARPQLTTDYIVEVVDNAGCSDTAHVQVRVLNQTELKAIISGTEFLCRFYDSASFKDNSVGNVTRRNWSFGNGQTASTAQPPLQFYTILPNDDNFIVRLAVADTSGCTDTAYHILKVLENCYIAVPNAFTPNGDGLNDFLYPVNANKATDLRFSVFARNGQLVFQSRHWSAKWDGTLNGMKQASGVYVWMLEYTDPSGKRISLKGTSLLIR